MDHQPAQSQSGCKQRRPNHIPAVTSISSGSTGRRVDATTGEEIARQAAADGDTAPVFTTDEILAAGRCILPEDVADVRALRTRPGLSQEAFTARFGFSVGAIRHYESHRRVPTGPARTLLWVIAREPDAVIRALVRG